MILAKFGWVNIQNLFSLDFLLIISSKSRPILSKMLNYAPSFLQRRQIESLRNERSLLAKWTTGNLISPGMRLFVVSGTTVEEVTVEILCNVESVRVLTNSIPVAWSFMNLVESGKSAPHATVNVTGGELHAVTGALTGKPKIEKAATLLISPHGLTEKAVTGDRDVDQLRRLLNDHRKVVMPISWKKLNREGSQVVKHWGHWKQVDCQIVITAEPLPELELSDTEIMKGKSLLSALKDTMEGRLTVSEVPLVSEST